VTLSGLISLAAATGVGLAVAGCSTGVTHAPGSNGPSVSSLITSMKSGFATASSVHVTGNFIVSGRHAAISLGMLRSGDETGTITSGSTVVNLLEVNGKAYDLVTRAFFKAIHKASHLPSSFCSVMCGKYVAVPSATFKSLSLSRISSSIEGDVPVPSSVPRLTATTYQGQRAYKLSGDGLSVYVAEHGTHYLLGIVDPAKFGTLSFSDWNAVPPVSPPPAGKIYSAG
jgi:hypothetical protein